MNPKILALLKARAAAVDRLEKAYATAQAENRPPTKEEHAAYAAAKEELESVKVQLAAAELVERERAELAQPAATPASMITMASAVAPVAAITGHDNAEDRPWGDSPTRALGSFLKAVRQVETVGIQNMDARLRPHMKAAASGANEATGSEGAFLLGQEMTAIINKRIFDVAVLAPRCSRMILPAGQSKVSLKLNGETSRVTGSRWGGVQVYWRAEAGTVTATKPKVREVDAKLESLMGLFYDTAESDEDSIIGQVAMEAFPDEIATELDFAIFSGHGAGKPAGFSTGSGRVTQAKETGQAAATIMGENVINMWARMPARARANAVWLTGGLAEPQLMEMTLPGGGLTPYPIYLPPGGLSAAPYGTIFGRPVIPFEGCSVVGTEGDIVLVDLSWYLLLLNGQEPVPESSIHVRFLYNENCYRWVYRCNGLPMTATPFTAADGTTTMAPYVTLATRA